MRTRSLILLLATAWHWPVQAATPAEAGKHEGHSTVQKQRDPTAGNDAVPASRTLPAQPGAINPANGQYYPPAGNGDVINPATGERYIGTPGGYINPNTGEFMPGVR